MAADAFKALSVLLCIHHFPPDRVAGAELYALRVARGLIARGHRVQVLCVSSDNDQRAHGGIDASDEVYQEISVRRISRDRAGTPDPIRASFDKPELENYLDTWIAELRPDVLHLVSGYLLGSAPLRAAQRAGVPTVVTLTDFWFLCPTLQLLRGDGSLCPGPSPLECARCLYDEQRRFRVIDQAAPRAMQLLWRTANQIPILGNAFGLPSRVSTLDTRIRELRDQLNGADAILAVTKFVADVHAANGIDRTRMVLTSYGVELESPTPLQAHDEIHFAFLGQVAPIKGVDVLIRALRQLDSSQRRARLTIYGRLNALPAYARRLRELAADDPAIVFAGEYPHSDLTRILNDTDVVVVPSLWYENAPHVILEAFAARRPVIGTNVGGIAEIVQDGKNGLLFERSSVTDLARAMQRILDEPELMERLAKGIAPPHTPSQELDDVLDTYQRVLESSHVASAEPTLETFS